jgi:hypothetical protein
MRWTKYLNAASVIAASVVHASTLTPPVIPLLVRNPYLSAWLGNARDNPWERWPIFWTGQEVHNLDYPRLSCWRALIRILFADWILGPSIGPFCKHGLSIVRQTSRFIE